MQAIAAFYMRFIVIQTILVIGLIALYLSGDLLRPFQGESRLFSSSVIVLALWGMTCIVNQSFSYAEWISEKLIRVGVIGMQIGILSAMTAMAGSLIGGGDLIQVAGLFLSSMSVGLHVSILALSSNLWLELNLRFLRSGDEQG